MKGTFRKFVEFAAFSLLTFAANAVLANGVEPRKVTTINDRVPTVEEVQGALFPDGIDYHERKTKEQQCEELKQNDIDCQPPPRLPSGVLESSLVFARGSATLTEQAKEFLRVVGAGLRAKMSALNNLLIEGHTDSTGSDLANRKLSQARADSVKSFLVKEFGISNIETKGVASANPKDPDHPESAINRRVQFVAQ